MTIVSMALLLKRNIEFPLPCRASKRILDVVFYFRFSVIFGMTLPARYLRGGIFIYLNAFCTIKFFEIDSMTARAKVYECLRASQFVLSICNTHLKPTGSMQRDDELASSTQICISGLTSCRNNTLHL